MKIEELKINPAELSKLKSILRQNRCFYPDCEEKAIKAHSIQRNGILSHLEDNVNGNMEVYFLDDDFEASDGAIQSKLKTKRQLHRRGIANASTFSGFCDSHDKIFSGTIEGVKFSGSKEQCFYHTFRTFAFSLHKDFEFFTAFQKITETGKSLVGSLGSVDISKIIQIVEQSPIKEQIESIPGYEKIKDYDNYKIQLEEQVVILDQVINSRLAGEKKRKDRFDNAILNKDFSRFEYEVRSVSGLFPFACATTFQFLNPILQPSEDGIAYAPDYALTVFPEVKSNQTHFIFGAFPENPNVAVMMSILRVKENEDFLKFTSDILLSRGSNMYLSPRMYGKLSAKEKAELIDSRINKNKQDIGVPKINLNLFDKRFKEIPIQTL